MEGRMPLNILTNDACQHGNARDQDAEDGSISPPGVHRTTVL